MGSSSPTFHGGLEAFLFYRTFAPGKGIHTETPIRCILDPHFAGPLRVHTIEGVAADLSDRKTWSLKGSRPILRE